jgi:hypothetical protein
MDERPTHTNLRLTTASDCLVLMEGVRRGIFRLVTRRLTDAERSLYIKPGCVFVWQEGKSIYFASYTSGVFTFKSCQIYYDVLRSVVVILRLK